MCCCSWGHFPVDVTATTFIDYQVKAPSQSWNPNTKFTFIVCAKLRTCHQCHCNRIWFSGPEITSANKLVQYLVSQMCIFVDGFSLCSVFCPEQTVLRFNSVHFVAIAIAIATVVYFHLFLYLVSLTSDNRNCDAVNRILKIKTMPLLTQKKICPLLTHHRHHRYYHPQ